MCQCGSGDRRVCQCGNGGGGGSGRECGFARVCVLV